MRKILPYTFQPENKGLPDDVLSLGPLYGFLQSRMPVETALIHKFYTYFADLIDEHAELKDQTSVDNIHTYDQILEVIYSFTTSISSSSEEMLWGLATPVSLMPFYGTNALAELADNRPADTDALVLQNDPLSEKRQHAFLYATILEKCYFYNSVLKKELILDFPDLQSSLNKYYKVEINTDFINVKPKGYLPSLDYSRIKCLPTEDELIEYLLAAIPLSFFVFEGLVVFTLTDITELHALGIIKDTMQVLDEQSRYIFETEVSSSLQTLAGNSKINFGFIPFVLLNNKPIIDFGDKTRSVLLSNPMKQYTIVVAEMEKFIQSPGGYILPDVSEGDDSIRPLVGVLQDAGVSSFALIPLFFNQHVVGALEMSSAEKGVITESVINKLDATFPVLAQLMKFVIDNIHDKISATVNEKFTAIQPAVQWKFSEAAWRYLSNSKDPQKRVEMEPVVFEKLYPLYGAIDIRNSSIERNEAVRKDQAFQLKLLKATLQSLKDVLSLNILEEMQFKTDKWIHTPGDDYNFLAEQQIGNYLEHDVLPFLQHIQIMHPGVLAITKNYLDATDPDTGEAFRHRRELESSIKMITQAASLYLDLMNVEIQKAYPCYFEKFRTDGVEYDIYIGQSITPDKPFDLLYLKNLRLMQLSSMAGICTQIWSLQSQMPTPLQTTQLIYINSETIDINFRRDEKRFDVEGAYNIRYQMIKKRIDKVGIKDTGERLTQPGKIAMVYTGRADGKEYISYINYLIEKGVLENDLEHLELEDLQGISGLKALRVGVNLNL